MATLLLKMRLVPDDEAADVRAMLDAARIPWYETEPSRWGVSHGGIWIRDDEDAPRAKALMAAQALIALVTALLVVARAVNILG